MIGEMSMSSGTARMLEGLGCPGMPNTLNGLPVKIDENVSLGEFVGEANLIVDKPIKVTRIRNIQ